MLSLTGLCPQTMFFFLEGMKLFTLQATGGLRVGRQAIQRAQLSHQRPYIQSPAQKH